MTSCRGNEAQCMKDYDNDGVNDKWPLFYDNYFVPAATPTSWRR